MENMKHSMILYLYIKTGVAFILAEALCIFTAFFVEKYSCLLFLPLVALWFAYAIWSIYKQEKSGNIITICANCEDILANHKVLNAMSKKQAYRFLSIPEDDAQPVTFYITEENGKFKPGETYCMLFRKTANNSLSERNLLTFQTYHYEIATTLTETEPSED